jgi:uncharacterized OsmC-like protein
MTNAIRMAVEGASAYLAEHPDEAAYTDSLATATVTDGLRRAGDRSTDRGEVLETDMPAAVGGAGSSASPGWYLRASVAACVASLATMRAAQLELQGFACEVDVDSESDDRGILGLDATVPGGPLSNARPAPDARGRVGLDRLEEIAVWAVEHCPVSDAIRRGAGPYRGHDRLTLGAVKRAGAAGRDRSALAALPGGTRRRRLFEIYGDAETMRHVGRTGRPVVDLAAAQRAVETLRRNEEANGFSLWATR